LSRKRDLRFPPLISREKDGGLPPGTSEKAASPSKLWREALGNSLLRINDENVTWRIIYRIYSDAILMLEVFSKKTNQTPKSIINVCKERIKRYESDANEGE
jgi:hypothetical protein